MLGARCLFNHISIWRLKNDFIILFSSSLGPCYQKIASSDNWSKIYCSKLNASWNEQSSLKCLLFSIPYWRRPLLPIEVKVDYWHLTRHIKHRHSGKERFDLTSMEECLKDYRSGLFEHSIHPLWAYCWNFCSGKAGTIPHLEYFALSIGFCIEYTKLDTLY